MKTLDPKTKVPCLVYSWSKQEEMQYYLDLNSDRLGISAVDQFVARLRLRQPLAMNVDRILRKETDLTVHPGQWACVNELELVYNYDGTGDILTTTLRILVELGWISKPAGKTQGVFGGVALIVKAGADPKRCVTAWKGMTPAEARDGANSAIRYLSGVITGSRHARRGVAIVLREKYNARLERARKLDIEF